MRVANTAHGDRCCSGIAAGRPNRSQTSGPAMCGN
nr:MAG TPA: hypothetical protein [Caudoviricetes sp.]